jgi:hypothetical protein
MATNRRLLEDVLARVRRLDAALAADSGHVEGIESTGAAPWAAPANEHDATEPPAPVPATGEASS